MADAELARWVAEVRAQAVTQPDLDLLRRPRTHPPGPELATVADLEVANEPPILTRIYRPSPSPLPLIVYVHGGGFVFGDLDSHDRTCRRLAALAAAAVLAADIRLAPEHPAPAAIEDVVAVVRWAATRPDPVGALVGVPALAGDSSGGTIALLAAVALAAGGGQVSALLLACPNADLTLSQPSLRAEGTGWGLEVSALEWFVRQWVPELDEAALRRFSPLHADLAGVPPTLLATAQHDPLRDEGAALAERLAGFGSVVEYLPHPGLVHGFLGLDVVSPAARRAGDGLMRRFGDLLPRS